MTARLALTFLCALGFLAAQPARAQAPAGEPDAPIEEAPGNFSIGLGAAYGPSYEGSDDYTIFPAGILRADFGPVALSTRGTYLYADVLDGDAAEAAAVGITVEPEGGSEQPTSQPIAMFDLGEATA